MKKIIFIFLCFFMFNVIVKADDTFYLGEKVPNMYVESVKGSNIHNGAPFLLHRSDGDIVYCINPFMNMSTTGIYKSYTYNDPLFKIPDEHLNMMNVAAYYGYGYENHTDIKWYGITQYLIWKYMLFDDVYFTDSYYGNRIDMYTNEVNELEDLVEKYYKYPSLRGKEYTLNPERKYEIADANKVLSSFEIKESEVDASINDNTLVINTKGSGTYKITFVKKSPVNRDYILYNLEGAQTLFYPGRINERTFSITITVNRYDVENKERLEASLDGAKYGIYKSNKLVKQFTLTNGSSYIPNLALGSYTLKEISNSKGYNKDTNVYDFTLTRDNSDIIINVYAKVIEGNLIINKYYGSDNDYKLDESAVFEIYNNGNLLKTVSGKVNEKLEYGTYLIKQVNGKKYYDLINEFNVSVLEEKDYKYDFYTDKTDEIKAYEELLNKREESLNHKEQNLIQIENKIEEEKNSLDNLKNEIIKKENELDSKKEDLNLKEQELIDLEKELNKTKEDIKKDHDLLDEKSKYLKELEDELSDLNNKLITKEDDLETLEDSISQKVIEISKLKEELNILGNKLKEKENNLSLLEESLNNRQKEMDKNREELQLLSNELSKREEELLKLENKKDEVLIVEVPNTSKKNYNKLVSKLLIILGSLFIIYAKKKTTSC